VLSKFRAFVVKGFDLLLWKSLGIKPKATPYHENTKGGKHERREGLFKHLCPFSCFRGEPVCFLRKITF